MSKYHTQFDESTQTIGTNLAGWTVRGGGSPTYAPAYMDPATLPVKRRYLPLVADSTTDYRCITWDAIDADTNRAKANLLTLFLVDLTTAEHIHLYARGAGSGTVTDFYRLRIAMSGANNVAFDKMAASAYTGSVVTATVTFTAAHAYYARFLVDGTTVRARFWDASLGMAGEPSTWSIDTTDSSVTAAGWVGFGTRHSTLTGKGAAFNFLAVGTNGDSAVAPRTNTEYTAWLASQTALRCVLAELSATGYDSSGSPYTKTVNWYIANHGYTSQQQDTPSGKHYEAAITSIPTFRREMSSALSGAAQTGFGDLVVGNPGQVPRHEKYTAVDLNGSSQYALAASSSSLNFGTGSFSVLLRGRYDDFTPSRAFGGVTKPGTAWNTAAGWGFGQGHTGTSIFAWIHDGVNFASGYITCDAGYRPVDLVGQFVEILYIVDRSAGTMKVMINGVMQSGSLSISSVTGSVNNANNFQVALSVGWYQDGLLDEVRAWSRALSISDGVSIYRRRGTDQSTSLALLWPCNEGTGTSLADKSGNSNTGTLSGSPSWVTGTRTLRGNEDQPGTRDDLLRMRWNRNYLKLYLGDPSWPKHDFRLIVLGQLKQPTAPDEKSIRFPITDVIDILSGRFQSNRFSAGPHQGKQIPYICGNPIAMEALETGTGLEFQIHDGAMASLADVWDDGVSLTGAHIISAVDAGTDTITSSTAHGLAVDARVYYITTPPAPLTTGVYYYVKTVPSTTTYTLAATRGGATINITATTTGGAASTFNWWEDLSNGKFTLVATPAGRVYVKQAAHETVGGDLNKLSRVLADAIFTKGAISLNFKDATSFAQLNTDLANTVGLVVYDESVSVLEVVSRLCAGANCWYGATPDGLIQAGRIGLPSATAVMSFTESDVVKGSLRMVDVILPINRATSAVRTARVWDANGPQNLAAFKDDFLLRRYYTEVGSAWPSAGIPLDDRPNRSQVADFPVLETVFASDSESPTETTRRETLYGVKLGIFEFETRLPASQLNIGDTVQVTYPRLGWKSYSASDPASPDNTATLDATKAVVIGIDTDIGRGRVKLKVFRRIPGYYPTADLN